MKNKKKQIDTIFISLIVAAMVSCILLAYYPRPERSNTPSHVHNVSVLEDPGGKLSLEEVQTMTDKFIGQESSTIFRKRSFSTFWIRCTINEPNIPSEFRYMEFACPNMEEMDVYFAGKTPLHIGKKVDVRKVPVKALNWYAPIPINHDSNTAVYIRFHSSTILRVPMRVVDGPAMIARSEATMVTFGIFFGIFIAILMVNMFAFVILRKKIFLTYSAYIVFLLLYHVRVHGFLYFLPMPFRVYEACVWIGLSGFGIFMSLFAKQFMSLRQRLPFVNGLLSLGIVVFIIQAAVGVFISSFYANEIAYVTGMIIPVLIMGTVLYLYMKGYKDLKFYLLAWCALLTATVIWATMPYAETFFSPNILFMMGTSLDSMLFTFSIFDMIRTGLREKEEMQAREKYYIALARTDSLTGLYNRRYLTEIVKQLEADKEMPPESALIMIDLDNFKQINDTYGHLIGDIILTRVGTIIKNHIRRTDIACRYGGDEFLVFLLGAKLETAQGIGEQIRKEILAETSYSETGEEIFTTISIGITETRIDDTFDGMFLRADAALYQAKKLGRNRIAVL